MSNEITNQIILTVNPDLSFSLNKAQVDFAEVLKDETELGGYRPVPS